MPRVLFAIFMMLALAAPAVAEDTSSSDELDLEDELEFLAEDVVVSAARHEQKRGFSPSAVIVISREDIEASPAATLVELLRHYPAVHVLVNNPSHNLVHLRGSYRVLLLDASLMDGSVKFFSDALGDMPLDFELLGTRIMATMALTWLP